MKLLILTMRFPYGTNHEVFFETELRALARTFEEVIILPMKIEATRRAVPGNVECWAPIASSGRWLYAQSFFHPQFWVTMARLLVGCANAGKFGWVQLRSCVVSASFDLAMRRHGNLKELLKSRDLVVYAYWGAITALCLPLAKAKGAVTCARYHGVDLYLERQENGGYIPFRREVQAAADLNVFVSEQGREYFASRAGAEVGGQQVVSRLGSPDFGPPSARTLETESRAAVLMVSVSQIVPVKRVHLIARLAKNMALRRPVEWHHFGGGHSTLLATELATDMPANLTVRMHGTTANSEIRRFYRSNRVDLFVNLSASEGIPVSVMEALSADIPAVAAKVGGTSEVVIDGQSGMLVPPEQCERSAELAVRVLEALAYDGLLSQCSAREIWLQLCDAEKNASAFAALLRGLAVR